LLFKGWSGVWLEGDNANVRAIQSSFRNALSDRKLVVLERFITASNINDLFAEGGVPDEPDLLSIDIDRNDYHVWNAIETIKPRVVIIEYNAIFRPGCRFVVPYVSDAQWDGSSNFGASLEALAELGNIKGYALVASSFAGCNAFFVRKDSLGDNFFAPGCVVTHFEPPRYFLYQKLGHPRKVEM
jgi:hypothetical protein